MLGPKLLLMVYGERVEGEIIGFNNYSHKKSGTFYRPLVKSKPAKIA